jgi:rod shape determining protein RodA
MHWNKRFLKNLNIYIPITVILLIIIGFIFISSAVEINKADSNGIIYIRTQLIAVVLGFIIIFLIQFFDYRIFDDYSDIIYYSTLFLLIIVLILGKTVAGGKRWILFGPLNFQPAELAKIIVILVLASLLTKKKDEIPYLTGLIKPFIYVLIPFILILLQNDLGTSLVIIFIFLVMLYMAGANTKFLGILFGGGFFTVILMISSHIIWGTPLPFLKEYQLNRLIVFINPGVDPFGIGYNIIQSKIAVGSGRLIGKGLFAGTQNQLNFLPAKHTDFIFSVIGEETGFIGILILILLYLLLLWQMLNVAKNARDDYGQLVVSGITAMFFFHIVENIGMTIGLMPITGITLPLISYGGSSMLTSLIAIGLVININLRNKKLMF